MITHAHEDRLGAVPYLWNQWRCPIYGTRITAEVLKNKLQEHGVLGQVIAHARFAKSVGVRQTLIGRNGDAYFLAPVLGIQRQIVKTGRLGWEKGRLRRI